MIIVVNIDLLKEQELIKEPTDKQHDGHGFVTRKHPISV